MKFGFLKALALTLFALFAPAALADDKGGQQQQQQQQNGGGQQQQQQQQPTHVTMTREDYDRLVAGQKKKEETGDGGGGGKGDDPLTERVKQDREAKDKATADAKAIEQSLAFTMGLDDFVKKNADLLPSEIGDIVKAASAERYDSAAAKASAVKVAVIKSFFAVQANVDALTEGHKRELDDYLKLTTTGRAEKAAHIYANVFEPCLEMNRRLKKAEELQRGQNGVQTSSGTEAAYRDRMIAASRKKYLGK